MVLGDSGGGVLWCWVILVVVVSEILVKTFALPSHGWGGQPSVGIRCQTELESWSGGIGSHVGVDHVGKGDYQSTPLHWQELSRDYQGMSRDYQSTPLQWQELLRDYRGLSRDYQSHTSYISRNCEGIIKGLSRIVKGLSIHHTTLAGTVKGLSRDYRGLSRDYRSTTGTVRGLSRDYRGL